MNHFREYQNLQMTIRTFEGYLVIECRIHLMLIIYCYGQFKNEYSFDGQGKTNKTSKTLSVVCVHNRALLRA